MRATAVNASNARVFGSKPGKSSVQSESVKDGRGAKERKMAEKLGKGVGDKKGVGKSSATQGSSRGGIGLYNQRGNRNKAE